MATIRTANEIIASLIDFYRRVQPNADTKPGTVIRDLFIEAPASQIALLYDELSNVSNLQSMRLVVGSDLDKLAKNYGIIRKKATPSTGVALCTFASINATMNINKGDILTSNNGFSFAVSSGVTVSSNSVNYYKSVATKYRDQLDSIGISDQYAVEVTVEATSSGSATNIGKYSIVKTSIVGISNVTNINAFSGGVDQEDDVTFRNRILSAFSGSSVGTALGYLNLAMSTNGVGDAEIIEPGDPLMTRDGTDVTINSDGTRTIVSEGSGGKVDVVILGTNLVESTESFIYQDKSNTNDPTNSKNNVVLGQIPADANKTINKKRIDDIKNGQLPLQPISALTQVTGSLSGSNFVEKTTDEYGRVSGNYELIKDTGVYAGSPWGFDTFHWISNKISLFSEDKVKGQYGGQDALTFSDVLNISNVQQSVSITNENSIVNSDRSLITLQHTPSINVTRVFNVNTGERYTVTSQNYDNTGTYNTTGRIKISGNTLPTSSDVLQVDYTWVISFDSTSDYDGLLNTYNTRTVNDSIDWGYSSLVKDEKIVFNKDVSGDYFVGYSTHPINSVISVNKFSEMDGIVTVITSGSYTNRLAVVLSNISEKVNSIDSITLKNFTSELYNTSQNNGLIINNATIVGIEILYNVTIILPTDTSAIVGQYVTVQANSSNIYTSSTLNGSFSSNKITIPLSLVDTAATSIVLKSNYIANIQDLFSSTTTSLPASRIGNGYNLSNNIGFSNVSVINNSYRENQTIQKNLSNQYYLDLSLSSTEYSIDKIISIIRISDGKELWNSDYPGTVTISSSNNIQLILSGLNSPVIGNKCFVVCYVNDLKRNQPFSFSNSVIKYRSDVLNVDSGTGRMYVNLNKFVAQSSGLTFKLISSNDNIILGTISDGYLTLNSDGTANIGSLTSGAMLSLYSNNPDILIKKINIFGATDPNNNGTYDINFYNLNNDTINISNIYNNISSKQICVVKLSDNKEVWTSSGTIDITNNKIILPTNSTLSVNDKVFVMFFKYNNLRKSLTRLICTTVDQVINSGSISVTGHTLSKAENIVFTATKNGLTQNLLEAVRKYLDLSSNTSIPSNIKLAKLVKLEKVETVSSSSDEVLNILTTYDTKYTTINDSCLYSDEMLEDNSLQNLEFILPNTQNNTLNLETKNIPALGDKLRVTFYILTENDSDSLSYTRNGSLYTNKKFALINKFAIISGFTSSQSTKISLSSFTQPALGARYKAYYDYTAPKQNERITTRYNYNKLISDVTFNIESGRPINSDVIVRGANSVLLDLTLNIVILDDYKSSSSNIKQNVKNKLITELTATQLGTTVDSVTLINIAQSVTGVARARIVYFNKNGKEGQVLTITAQKDEYFVPNNVIVNTETR